MPVEVKMPRLSDTMEVGTVVKWNVREGQKVRSGDVIADIETDKATMELQSFDDGTVASLTVPEGKAVKVGTTIMLLAAQGEDVAAVGGGSPGAKPPAEAAAAQAGVGAGPARGPEVAPARTVQEEDEKGVPTRLAPSPAAGVAPGTDGGQRDPGGVPDARSAPPVPGAGNGHAAGVRAGGSGAAPTGEAGRVFASPLARKVARERRVDLAGIEGTGPSGRITRRDVEAAAGSAGVQPPGAGAREAGTGRAAVPAPPALLSAPGSALQARMVPLSGVRRIIAARLVESKRTVPHYQVTVTARVDGLLQLREQLNSQLAGQGVKLSVNDFLVRACALAMHQHPLINSRWSGAPGSEEIEIVGVVNVGIAIALPEERGGGLVVATVRDADRKGLRHISAETRELSERARSRGLTIQEMSDSTFTISNLGMFGVDHFTAIINPPNTAILAVGAAVQRPVVEGGPGPGARLAIGWEMALTMSSDHRVIDGATAAAYLATVKGLLERPATLLV